MVHMVEHWALIRGTFVMDLDGYIAKGPVDEFFNHGLTRVLSGSKRISEGKKGGFEVLEEGGVYFAEGFNESCNG